MLLVLLALTMALCALVDPYAVLGTPLVAGLNARKTAAIDWPRLSKAYMVQRARPATIILGNSSADVGFAPASAAWPEAARPVFNLAIDGGLPGNHLRYLQHALATASPRRVVLAVNFNESMVLTSRRVAASVQSQFDFEQRMRVLADGRPNPAYAGGRAADLIFATLSFTALSDSIRTLLHQHGTGIAAQSEAGWNNGAMMIGWTRQDGAYAMAMRKDREKIGQYLSWRSRKVLDIDSVFRLVQVVREHGAELSIVILPNHADGLEVLRQTGLDADYDAWKTALVDGVSRAAPDHVAIWDFSGYSPYTTEELPPPQDRGPGLRWFYEPVHFKPALGAIMAARIEGAAEPAGFGVQLTPGTVAAQIAAYHQAQAAWVASHPADVARIAALVAAAQK